MKVEILTGPPGTGKNAIAKLIAQKRERCAVIDVDLVRWMILQPHHAPWDGIEGKEQQKLGVFNASILARSFIQSNFDVLILDVVSDETVEVYKKELEGLNPKIILLLPTFEEIKKRNTIRSPRLQENEIEMLYKDQEQFAGFDKKIDNTNMSAEDVANELL